jgi:hypothetical protein
VARQVPRPDPGALNVGHGHVHPRPDGRRARCGGPGLCGTCSAEATQKYAEEWARHEAARGALNDVAAALADLRADSPASRERLIAFLAPAHEALSALLAVEEPPPPPPEGNPHGLDVRVHARACGIVPHGHGSACHRLCPTCGGRADFEHVGLQGDTTRRGL